MRIFAAMILVLSLSACAVGRSTIDISELQKFSNPDAGQTVKILAVEDVRQFQIKPASPDIPSLSEDRAKDQMVKARAVARKRNGYGMAMGDVVLPEGQTVSNLIRQAVANGFRAAGYRTLEENDGGYDNAPAVKASIFQFWSWFQPGFWSVTVHNKAQIKLESSLPGLNNGLVVNSKVEEKMAAVTDEDWRNNVMSGIKRLTEEVANKLSGLKQSVAK